MTNDKTKQIMRIDELISIAVRAEDWNMVAELETEKAELESNGWKKGFAIGYGSAFIGILLSRLMPRFYNRYIVHRNNK